MTKLLRALPVQLSLTAILVFFGLGLSRAGAQNPSDAQPPSNSHNASGPPQEQIRVVGHLPLDNIHVNQMFVQQHDSKVYLFLHRPAEEAYALVDVTHPDKPALVNREALKSRRGQVEGPASGSVFALTVTPENASQAASSPTTLPAETVQLVDMSNPRNSKTVKTFKGVTAIYPDDGRKLVYLVNPEGLWIISHHLNRPLPFCTSSAAINPEPDCQ